MLIFCYCIPLTPKKKFFSFSQIRYYNDMEMFCGGKPVQWDQNGKIKT